MLNKSKGNMYGFVTHTWNPIKGKCPHECSYCYMNKMYKRYKWDETLRFDEKCFGDFLPDDSFIFVGSSIDMFAEKVPSEWIKDVLKFCSNYKSKFLFQSKNPERFNDLWFPENMILATTIETNREDVRIYSKAPSISNRIYGISRCKGKIMITIEPIMDFDLKEMIKIIKHITPIQVNIGADSGNNKLPEPPKEKIEELIKELKKFTTVHLKDNLQRLMV